MRTIGFKPNMCTHKKSNGMMEFDAISFCFTLLFNRTFLRYLKHTLWQKKSRYALTLVLRYVKCQSRLSKVLLWLLFQYFQSRVFQKLITLCEVFTFLVRFHLKTGLSQQAWTKNSSLDFIKDNNTPQFTRPRTKHIQIRYNTLERVPSHSMCIVCVISTTKFFLWSSFLTSKWYQQ